jgi:trimeric autotransporter adhesin
VRHSRPALAITAALVLAASAAPALAATTTTPATGSARSTLTLLDLALGGHQVSAGEIAAVASNTGSRVAQLVVTPAVLDGTAVGRQTVSPANAPATVPSGSPQSVSVPNLLTVTGPTLTLDAQSGPTAVFTSAVLKALGQVTLTPAGLASLPINLQAASLNNIAKVTATQTEATKSVVIGGLSLPSVNQLLSSLGVDLNALLNQLTQGNLDKLGGLVGANLATLNAAVDTAQAALGSAVPTTLNAAQTALTSAQTTLASDNAALTAANTALAAANAAWSSALTTALAGPLGAALGLAGIGSASTPQDYLTAVAGTPAISDTTLVDAANAVVSAEAVQSAAAAAAAAAQTLVDNLNALVDALQALVTGVLNAVTGDTDPLAALGNISVVTKAIASSHSPTPVAEAKVGTLKILGNNAVPSQLTSVLGTTTKTLSDVLNSVPGVAFTPPSVGIGSGHTGTSTVGSTHKATASITGLTITLPSIAMPTALSTITTAVPGAATIVGNVVSVLGGTVHVAVLAESATHTPATSTTSGSPGSSAGGPSLAGTGMSRTIPVVAVLFVLTALAVLHRRRVSTES